VAVLSSSPEASASDRLGLTLFLAAMVHGIVILGIGFNNDVFSTAFQHSMDVILVQTQSETEPEDAQKIAQFNQQASGSRDEGDRPSSPVSSRIPLPSEGVAAAPQERQVTQVSLQQAQQLLHSQAKAEDSVTSDKNTQTKKEALTPAEQQRLRREMEIAQLTAELEARQRAYAQRPKIHFIDATSAKSAVEAAYITDWVQRVEGIGNLNYPEEARRDRISGKLILNVLLDTKGEVVKVQVAVSSGNRVLDEAAVQIVKISSPFPAFSAEMKEKYDQLMITRTWLFKTNHVK
jgi:protein TonB